MFWLASAARASVKALELMKGNASVAAISTGWIVVSCQGRSPASVSATSANCERSAVPIAPQPCMRGFARSEIALASALASSGLTPDPPARIWFKRMIRAARTSESSSSGPTPAQWLRKSRRAWSVPGSATWTDRFAPTPVLAPYTSPRCLASSSRRWAVSTLSHAEGRTLQSRSPDITATS